MRVITAQAMRAILFANATVTNRTGRRSRTDLSQAPTALFHLLNMLEDESCPRPAAIIGCPVGFVGAAEAKAALMARAPAPALTVEGRLGGSAITAAAVNALASRSE